MALLSVIILGTVLLAAVARECLSGWQARTHVLDAEAHEQARSLAEDCANAALARLLTDPAYGGDTADDSPAGTCQILPVTFDSSAPGTATVKTHAAVRGFYSDLTITVRLRAACAGTSSTTGVQIISWHEVPTHE